MHRRSSCTRQERVIVLDAYSFMPLSEMNHFVGNACWLPVVPAHAVLWYLKEVLPVLFLFIHIAVYDIVRSTLPPRRLHHDGAPAYAETFTRTVAPSTIAPA
jgi:hypothetical protein